MTTYEFKRWISYPILPVLLIQVRQELKKLIKRSSSKLQILDVGGRKSPYTIGLSTDVVLLDVPQENHTQESLNLGFTDNILSSIKNDRSNISDVIIQDMTKSKLNDESYDAVVCVEVIEHVEADDLFVQNIAKVIKKNGWAYFTTPNGDFIKNEGPNKNPDHKRHYTKDQLKKLLEKYFAEVDVYYAVRTGKFRLWSLKSYSLNKPHLIIRSMLGSWINRFQSSNVKESKTHTAHLIAVAMK